MNKIRNSIYFLILAFLVFLSFHCKETAKPNPAPKEITVYDSILEFGIFQKPNKGTLIPIANGFKYELVTPLFSDYTYKERIIFLPTGSQIQYDPNKEFAMPIGTIIAKTFSMPANIAQPSQNIKRLETRLLIHQPKGWFGVSYIWNETETDAKISYAGKIIPIQTIDYNGNPMKFNYAVPARNQCTSCHQSYEGRKQSIVPIGIKAKHLNKDFDFKSGRENQLSHWKKEGILVGLPVFGAPKLVDYQDSNASLDDRARSYLDINCAHCHQETGAGGINSKLMLNFEEKDSSLWGVCKSPGSAGKGGGGRKYDIVPGYPEKSILYFRLATTESGAMMPQIGRAIVHQEGAALVEEWIRSMPSNPCP
jgi:uncharacterized repeat protein (TIGR03806 family)